MGGVAYSFGINRDVSWDLGMAGQGFDIFMYDPTIEGLPLEDSHFHFFREGIAGSEKPEENLYTLHHFLQKNGHENERNMVLKIDTEGAEWDFLQEVDTVTLKQFDQIVFEFHDLTVASSYAEMAKKIAAFVKLNQTHQLIHLHGTNMDVQIVIDDYIWPNALEATYVNRDNYRIKSGDEIVLPNPFDRPNDEHRQELILGKWNERV